MGVLIREVPQYTKPRVFSSVLIGVGGANGEDYWSQRMAEFQGKHHRLAFHETMEKIYRRLYQNATKIH